MLQLVKVLSAAKRILPIIDNKNKIIDNENSKKPLDLKNSNIKFKILNFAYKSNFEKKVLKNINLEF